jgi:hypothetical protein
MGRSRCLGLLISLLVVLTTSCSGGGAGDTSGVSTPSPISTPTVPSPPPETRSPKPPDQDGRLEGTYIVKYTLLSSNIPGSDRVEQNRWKIEARCKEGGSCNVRVESLTNRWKSTGIWRKGNYRWARSISRAYTCGSSGNVDYYIGATYEYSIRGQRLRFVDGEWVISSFDGTLDSRGVRGCGLSGTAEEKWAIQGKLK